MLSLMVLASLFVEVPPNCTKKREGEISTEYIRLSSLSHLLPSVRRFPSPYRSIHFGVTYPRRTGGKRLDKNRMRKRVLLFEIQRCTLMFSVSNRRFWGFFLTTLVDICGIHFCRRALKSHQNVIHSPMKVGYRSFNLIIPTELSEFAARKFSTKKQY